jgi:large subunit ribosomal protein L9
MKVFLIKDVAQIGRAGQLVKVADGYAFNFLFPRKLAFEVKPGQEKTLEARGMTVEKKEEKVLSKSSVLAEKISSLSITIKRKLHDEQKLYGAVTASELVELLLAQGIQVSKNQLLLDKPIKTKGVFEVQVKLSTKLQPHFTLKIVGE